MRRPHVGKTKIKSYLLSLNPLVNAFSPLLPPGSTLAAIFLQVSRASKNFVNTYEPPKYRMKIN